MKTISEIESAIDDLQESDFQRLLSWIERYSRKRQSTGTVAESAKEAALIATAGCLSMEEGLEFSKAVAEAGKSAPDSHEW